MLLEKIFNAHMTNPQDKAENVKTIRELLGMGEDDFVLPTAPMEPPPPTVSAPVFDLPVADIPGTEAGFEQILVAEENPGQPHTSEVAEFVPVVHSKSFLSRDWVRYPIIFLVTLGFFYMVLNFRGLTKQLFGYIIPPASNEQAVLGGEQADFNAWIAKYYVYINDAQVISANADTDGDGLTNMDEFHLGTNPFRADTDRDGSDDGNETLRSTNPLYEGAMLAYQQKKVADHIDTKAIASRRNFDQTQQVAGQTHQLPIEPVNRFIVDTSKPGEIYIPRLEITAQVTWSRAFSTMEEDLKYGVAHHPETPYPGEYGTASIHGHSSGNWNDGDFKTVFTKINFLEPGDEVFVTVHSLSGEIRKYRFIVRSEKVYSKTDPEQFQQRNGNFLNLSTSWPVGTARERYVVTTKLSGL